MVPVGTVKVEESGKLGRPLRSPADGARPASPAAPSTRSKSPAPPTASLSAAIAKARKTKNESAYTGTPVLSGKITGPLVGAGERSEQKATRLQASSLPGFMIPAGSSCSLTARSTSRPVRADLGLHVGGVVAADGVVVGDRAAAGDDRLEAARLTWRHCSISAPCAGAGDEGEVERGAVGVGVREVAEDEARRSLAGQRVADRAADGRVQLGQPRSRCARSRASRPSPPSPSACRAGRGPGSGRAPRSGRPTGRGRRRRRACSARTLERAAPGDRLLLALEADDDQGAAAAAAQAQVAAEEAAGERRAGPRAPARPRSPPRRRRGSRRAGRVPAPARARSPPPPRSSRRSRPRSGAASAPGAPARSRRGSRRRRPRSRPRARAAPGRRRCAASPASPGRRPGAIRRTELTSESKRP